MRRESESLRRAHLREVDAVLAVRLARERALPLEEVERDDVRAAVRIGRAEAHGAEEAREEGDVVVLDRLLSHLALRVELPHHVQAEDVRLPSSSAL